MSTISKSISKGEKDHHLLIPNFAPMFRGRRRRSESSSMGSGGGGK